MTVPAQVFPDLSAEQQEHVVSAVRAALAG